MCVRVTLISSVPVQPCPAALESCYLYGHLKLTHSSFSSHLDDITLYQAANPSAVRRMPVLRDHNRARRSRKILPRPRSWSARTSQEDVAVLMVIECLHAQVDVTAEDAAPTGGLPAVDEQAVKAADPMASVLGITQRQMGAGWTTHDPWRAIKAGVSSVKPHKSQVRPRQELLDPHRRRSLQTALLSALECISHAGQGGQEKGGINDSESSQNCCGKASVVTQSVGKVLSSFFITVVIEFTSFMAELLNSQFHAGLCK